jgi:hypothetical protein
MKRKNNRKLRLKPRSDRKRPTSSVRKIRVINVPRTAKQLSAMTSESQNRWIRITQMISKMRADRVSLREASREFGLDPRIVIRLGKSALRKRKNGQYAAKPADNLLRVLAMPTANGVHEVAIRGSKQATQVGKYWAAVQKYLQTGNTSALAKFRRTHIRDASGKKIPLILDTGVIDQLGSAGVLSFESLYAKAV